MIEHFSRFDGRFSTIKCTTDSKYIGLNEKISEVPNYPHLSPINVMMNRN